MQPTNPEEAVDILAKMAIQLPILTGVVIIAGLVYLAIRWDDMRRQQAQDNFVKMVKEIVEAMRDKDR